eukprot:TRINITY_DN6893_c1_g6_i1.p1 TRINITY_DN6893_c1_g6~~TRINITY_DN6893_c1_g6_i1.p1  ORF type:complete len:270 (-),score=43.69 TRINITY_DN6893_c1_g6_i1:172-900(-)
MASFTANKVFALLTVSALISSAFAARSDENELLQDLIAEAPVIRRSPPASNPPSVVGTESAVKTPLPVVEEPANVQKTAASARNFYDTVQESIFVTGPMPLVTAMSKWADTRTLIFMAMAIFGMASQVMSAWHTLKKGLNKLNKMEEEAESQRAAFQPSAPRDFSAAERLEEEQFRQMREAHARRIAERQSRPTRGREGFRPVDASQGRLTGSSHRSKSATGAASPCVSEVSSMRRSRSLGR